MKSLKHLVSAILFASLLLGCSGGDSSSGLDKSRTEITEDSEELSVDEPSTEIVDDDEESIVDELNLVEQTASSFKVTTPNGGQKWTTGKSYAIKWTKGKAGATVKIHLLKSGKHYKWISKKTKNDGKHTWKIPATVATGSAYKIKIVSIKNKKIFDTSNKTFKITKATSGGTLKVTTPNGGQKWTTGKSYSIKWSKGNAGAKVKIQLLENGKVYKWITTSTANDGQHTWKIPANLATASTYTIKITSLKNSKIVDVSNAPFKIVNKSGYIKISRTNISCELQHYGGFSVSELRVKGYLTNTYSRSVQSATLEVKLYDSSNRLLLTRYWKEFDMSSRPWRPKSIHLFSERWWDDFPTNVCVNFSEATLRAIRVYF